MILPVCTVVTENCLSEFLLFKASLEQFHECDWFISSDEYVKNYLDNNSNLILNNERFHCHLLIESDDCDHVINDETQKGYHLVGDVDYNDVKEKVSAITPVPGGVGPMTIACLLRNTTIAFKNKEIK